jgi:hypothetical protein
MTKAITSQVMVACAIRFANDCGMDPRPKLLCDALPLGIARGCVQCFDLTSKVSFDQSPFQFAIDRQQATLDRKWLRTTDESSDLFVVRQHLIHVAQRGLDLGRRKITGDNHGKKLAAIANGHDVLSFRQCAQDHLLDGFRADIVAGAGNDEVFEAPDNLPVSLLVRFSLIACAKPAVL